MLSKENKTWIRIDWEWKLCWNLHNEVLSVQGGGGVPERRLEKEAFQRGGWEEEVFQRGGQEEEVFQRGGVPERRRLGAGGVPERRLGGWRKRST